jgi:hypothetical protein
MENFKFLVIDHENGQCSAVTVEAEDESESWDMLDLNMWESAVFLREGLLDNIKKTIMEVLN